MARSDRNTLHVEDAQILFQESYPDEQFILRVQTKKIASLAKAGSFVHLSCSPGIPMRRPLSIMRVDAEAGWVEFLYKIVGTGLRALSERQVGETLNMIGPIGKPFELDAGKRQPVLIGGGVGIPPMIYLADEIRHIQNAQPVLFMGSESPFPFELTTSAFSLAGIPADTNRNLQLTEDWGIPGRLASLQNYEGVFPGYVTDLAAAWLDTLSKPQLAQIEIFACGPTPMLHACAKLARRFELPAQVSLEEHMACAVGGCAGCTVLIDTPEGPAMKRVCVDGPVFNAAQVTAFS